MAPFSNAFLNPPAERLGASNAVLWGRGRREYYVREFPGPLSIKSLIWGAAEWRVGRSRFEVDANSYLILNHDQRYSMTVESKTPVETFCVFFQRGFVEDAWSSLTRPHALLLDDPFGGAAAPVGFYERLRSADTLISPVLARLRRAVESGGESDELFMRLALGLAHLRSELPQEIRRLPAVRSSTRDELLKRVLTGKQLIDEAFGTPLQLATIARAACLSVFHFHRLFKAVFRETPHDYTTRRRLEKAARLLRETDEPVTNICLEIGFQSLGSFSTLFRARFGAPPGEFRRARKARSEKYSAPVWSKMDTL